MKNKKHSRNLLRKILVLYLLLPTIGGTSVYAAEQCDPNTPGANVIIGTEGNDVLRGTSGNDIILGKGGNDKLYGLDGMDCIDGGSGNDYIYGGKKNDRLYGGEGNDVLKGNRDNDLLDGGPGKDRLNGGRGKDTCYLEQSERKRSCETIKTGGTVTPPPPPIKPPVQPPVVKPPVLGNQALGKATRQSSTGYGGSSSRAVDGNTNGKYFSKSTTHTSNQITPFWEVDLDSSKQVGTVKVFNRTDCCTDRLNNFFLLISEKPFGSRSLAELLADNTVFKTLEAGAASAVTQITANTKGRYVRIQLNGKGYLSLAEVEVFSGPPVKPPVVKPPVKPPVVKPPVKPPVVKPPVKPPVVKPPVKPPVVKPPVKPPVVKPPVKPPVVKPPVEGNRALKKPTVQSSTYAGSAVSSRAVDGNTSGNYFNRSVTHTNQENDPFWQVDLGSIQPVGEIKVFNRTDCCSDRLKNYYVFVSDTPFGSRSLKELLADKSVFNSLQKGIAPDEGRIMTKTSGRYIRVQMSGQVTLQLAEVEVYQVSSVPNKAPVLTVPGSLSTEAGFPLNFTIRATDTNVGDLLTLSAASLPFGAIFTDNNNGTASFRWTPQERNIGTYTFEFTAKDDGIPELSDKKTLTLTVKPKNVNAGSLANLTKMTPEETLRKAAMLMAGRLPTQAEYAQASTEAGLFNAIANLMDGDTFAEFIEDAANRNFLTAGVPNPEKLEADFPKLKTLRTKNKNEYNATIKDLRQEPLALLRYIAENDISYKEVLTANYTMVTQRLNDVYQGNLLSGFNTGNKWAKATLPSISQSRNGLTNKQYPHAGVLTTPSWLSRFPTTGSNRNRHRSKMLYIQFLGFDIESLGLRPQVGQPSSKTLVPVMEDPGCLLCHVPMDPVAGAFGNWGDNGQFWQESGTDALDSEYKSNSYYTRADNTPWYMAGDTWYQDGLLPGFEGKDMPGGYGPFDQNNVGSTNGNGGQERLQWLAKEVVEDPRFAKAAARFWFFGIFGREPLFEPQDATGKSFADDIAKYRTEDRALTEAAKVFTDSGYIVRDLLSALLTSDLYRAESTPVTLNSQQTVEFDHVGKGRPSSTLAMNAKSMAIVNEPLFTDIYTGPGLVFGGFDGGTTTSMGLSSITTTSLNALENAMKVLLCDKGILRSDRQLPQQSRLLMTFADDSVIPNANGEASIKQNIQYLFKRFLGDDLAINDPEIGRAYSLFQDVYNNKQPNSTNLTVQCEAGNANSAGMRAWNAVLAYLITDFRFLSE